MKEGVYFCPVLGHLYSMGTLYWYTLHDFGTLCTAAREYGRYSRLTSSPVLRMRIVHCRASVSVACLVAVTHELTAN
jgi:hypothetical protein